MNYTNQARTCTLTAIRSALSVPSTAHPSDLITAPSLVEIPNPSLEQVGSDPTLQCFKKMLELAGGECYVLLTINELSATIKEILNSFQGQTLLLPQDPNLDRFNINEIAEQVGCCTKRINEISKTQAAQVTAGITCTQAGIADTGTVVLLHTTPEDRLTALLPEVHIVLLQKEAVYPDKVTYLQQMRKTGFDFETTPLTWVTGPSSTADIEKVLVRGAHGPRRLIVLLY